MPVSDEFRHDLREHYRRALTDTLGAADLVEISDTFAAYLHAKDLMVGDPATCKAGYTAENAYLAAIEVFPDAQRILVAAYLGVEVPS